MRDLASCFSMSSTRLHRNAALMATRVVLWTGSCRSSSQSWTELRLGRAATSSSSVQRIGLTYLTPHYYGLVGGCL